VHQAIEWASLQIQEFFNFTARVQKFLNTAAHLQTAEPPFRSCPPRQQVPYEFHMETPDDHKELRLLW
jgi:hypothetical protein